MKSGDRRGMSDVVASVLLILLVIILAILIFLWAKSFFAEHIEKFGEPIESMCDSAVFEVSRIPNDGDTDILEVINSGNVDIKALGIKKSLNGNSEIETINFTLHSGESGAKTVLLKMNGTDEVPDKIEIFPVLAGNVKGSEDVRLFSCYGYSEPIIL